MKAFPFNNWLRESWKRDGIAPHLFLELMDGTIESTAVKAEDLIHSDGLETYMSLEAKIIKRALFVYPSPAVAKIFSIFDERVFYFGGPIDKNKLIEGICTLSKQQAFENLSLTFIEFIAFLQKHTAARVQYTGNIPPKDNPSQFTA